MTLHGFESLWKNTINCRNIKSQCRLYFKSLNFQILKRLSSIVRSWNLINSTARSTHTVQNFASNRPMMRWQLELRGHWLRCIATEFHSNCIWAHYLWRIHYWHWPMNDLVCFNEGYKTKLFLMEPFCFLGILRFQSFIFIDNKLFYLNL